MTHTSIVVLLLFHSRPLSKKTTGREGGERVTTPSPPASYTNNHSYCSSLLQRQRILNFLSIKYNNTLILYYAGLRE